MEDGVYDTSLESAALVSVLLLLTLSIGITDLSGQVYSVAYFGVVSTILFAGRRLACLRRSENTPMREPERR